MAMIRSNSWPYIRHAPRNVRQTSIEDPTLDPWDQEKLYTKIANDEIRLMTLFPGVNDEPLRANLEVVSLSSAPPFLAVSYHWGPTDRTRTMIINDRSVGITESLFAALRKFRFAGSGTRCLWADAICINQEDRDETTSQVNMMASIYREAETVLVYLGEHKPMYALACWTITWLYWYGTNAEKEEEYTFLDIVFIKSFEAALLNAADQFVCGCVTVASSFQWRADSLTGRLQEGMQAMKELLNSSWFHRLWTLQENAVAKVTIFWFGGHMVTWNLLRVAIRECGAYAHSPSPFTTQERDVFRRSAQIVHVVDVYNATIKARTSERRTQSLLALMVETWKLKSSLAKDRLNSVRALAFIEDEADLKFDVDLPIADFWVRVACFILNGRCGWDSPKIYGTPVCRSFVLTLAGLQFDRKNDKLPSWVPDMGDLDRESYRKYVSCGGSNRAGGQSRAFRIDTKSTPGLLYIHGIPLSTIVETLPGSQYWCPVDKEEAEAAASSWSRRFTTESGQAPSVEAQSTNYHDIQDPPLPELAVWEDYYWRSLHERLFPWYITCYDFAYEQALISTDGKYKVNDFSALITQGSIQNSPEIMENFSGIPRRRERILESASEWIENLRRARGLNAGALPSPEQFFEDAIIFLHPYFFFNDLYRDETCILARFSDGRVGWVPQHARKDDVVYLLKAAPEPYILRPAQTEDGDELYCPKGAKLYTLVGDAYIHGVMKGEAWPHDLEINEDLVIGMM